MKILTTLAVAAAFSTPVAAQALNEPFDTSVTGNFPPTGWNLTLLPGHVTAEQWNDTTISLFNGMSAGSVSLADAAGHGYGTALSDDRLESPMLDLSAYAAPELVYDGCLGWYNYMSHTSIYFGLSDIEVSTDSGATWTSIWSEAATANYYTVGIVEDLSAYAGNSNVMLGFHYQGDFAHEWGIDNVVVQNVGPTGPALAIAAGAPGGSMTFDFTNFSASAQAAVIYGPAGTLNVTSGPCAGISVDVLPLNFPPVSGLIIVPTDPAGAASLTQNVPAAGAGLSVQAVDVATCGVSNSVVL